MSKLTFPETRNRDVIALRENEIRSSCGVAGENSYSLFDSSAAAPDFERSSARTILVVEDEEIVLRSTAEVLQANGYNVFFATQGSEAIKICRNVARLDLLLADLVMPGVDGCEVARVITSLFPEIRVILMTGYSERYLDKGLSLKTQTYLRKPFSAVTLLECVRETLRNHERRLRGRRCGLPRDNYRVG